MKVGRRYGLAVIGSAALLAFVTVPTGSASGFAAQDVHEDTHVDGESPPAFDDLPDSSELDEPVLWSGQMVNQDGSPGVGTVTAQARPVAGMLPELPSIPVATASLDAQGRFTLRTANTQQIEERADQSGWVIFMLVGSGSDGMAMAIDSLRFSDGTWVTATSSQDVPSGVSGALDSPGHASAAPALTSPTSDSSDPEAPAAIVLSHEGLREQGSGQKNHIPPPGQCTYASQTYASTSYTGVAEMNLAGDSLWTGEFTYRSSASTTLAVGGGAEFGPFGAIGSMTLTDSSGATANGPISARGRTELRTQIAWNKLRWSCYGGGSQFYDKYTLEPTDWVGGISAPVSGASPACDNRYRSTFPGGWRYTRQAGSSESFQTSGSVALNFKPAIRTEFSVSRGSQSSSDAELSYVNGSWAEKQLCGSNNFINYHTRLVSMK